MNEAEDSVSYEKQNKYSTYTYMKCIRRQIYEIFPFINIRTDRFPPPFEVKSLSEQHGDELG